MTAEVSWRSGVRDRHRLKEAHNAIRDGRIAVLRHDQIESESGFVLQMMSSIFVIF